MPDTQNSSSSSFPQSQRELVGLAMQRGCRSATPAPAAPLSQRDLVRKALARGLSGTGKARQSAPRTGIYR